MLAPLIRMHPARAPGVDTMMGANKTVLLSKGIDNEAEKCD